MQPTRYTRQLLIFYVLACLLSWSIWLPLWGPAWGIVGLPVLPYHHAWGGLGPMIAAFGTHALLGTKRENRQLLQSCLQAKPLAYLLVALFAPFVLAAVAAVLSTLIYGTPLQFSGIAQPAEFPEMGLPLFFGYNLLFFGFGEEVGWRGFMLPRLQSRFNALGAALVLTALWALWHWPLLLYRPGYSQMDAAGVAGWVFSLLTGSILLSWLYNSSRGSVLICAVFHATIDIPFTSRLTDPRLMGLLGFLITVWGIAILVWKKPAHLSHRPRHTLQQAEPTFR